MGKGQTAQTGPSSQDVCTATEGRKGPTPRTFREINISHNSHHRLAREGGEATDPEPQEGLSAPREACLCPTPGRGEWWK